MLKRALLVVAATSALSACAAGVANYARLDASPEQKKFDSTACTQQARTNSVYQRSDYLYYPTQNFDRGLGRVEEAAQVQANMYDRCMKSRGYARTA